MSHKSSTLERRCATARNFTHSVSSSTASAASGPSFEKEEEGEGEEAEETLQTGGMACFETERSARDRLPAGSPAAGRIIGSGVEPKAGDHREAVAVPGVNGDPLAASAISILPKFLGTHRGWNKPRRAQSIRHSAGAVVAAVFERTMTAAVTVRLRTKLIRRPNGAFHREGRIRGRGGHSTAKLRVFARNGGSRRRKRGGQTALD